jgi:hypothetical protein
LKRPRQGGDAGRASGPHLIAVGPQHERRRLRTNAIDIAPGIAIEDQITDDQQTRVGK